MAAQDQIHVTVFDNDASVGRARARLRLESGLQAITYPFAAEFLRSQKRHHFDFRSLDARLADLSGLGLQDRLTKTGRHTPTIFITASDAPGVGERAERLSGDGPRRQSASGQELLQKIRRLICTGEDMEHE